MSDLAVKFSDIDDVCISTFRFSDLTFDPVLHLLSSKGKTVYLRHQLNSLLTILVENANKGVSRKKLIDSIWDGNIHTGQKALTHSICKLRTILQSISDSEINIITIPKFGYCLVSKSIQYTE